ncbi:kinase-like protein [Hypoxylon crocopeplum]|nr:kinase-like protein [Hypoxylon crocopeplum]
MNVRMASTLVGQSGRQYVKGNMLQPHPTKPELSIYRAEYMRESIFNQSLDLKRKFAHSRHLRMPVDYNESEHTLVFDYFRSTLLVSLQGNSAFPVEARKLILRQTGETLKELHDENWIHINVKPDNILVDWEEDDRGRVQIKKVALGDLDCALRLQGDRPLRLPGANRIGNVMWRSPEAQTGKGIAKPSDVFSFGLVCIFGLTSQQIMRLDMEDLRENNMFPEQEILYRLFLFFGPQLPQGLLTQVDDEAWSKLLTFASEWAQDVTVEDLGSTFEYWTEEDFPNLTVEAKEVISMMTNLDPTARATMGEVLQHPWWKGCQQNFYEKP